MNTNEIAWCSKSYDATRMRVARAGRTDECQAPQNELTRTKE